MDYNLQTDRALLKVQEMHLALKYFEIFRDNISVDHILFSLRLFYEVTEPFCRPLR